MSSHVQPAIIKITLKIIVNMIMIKMIMIKMIIMIMIMDAVFAVYDHYQCIQSSIMIMINAGFFFISEMNVMFCFIYFSFAHLLVNALLGNCCNQHQETGAEEHSWKHLKAYQSWHYRVP